MYSVTLASCKSDKDGGVKQLRFENNGLFLDCNNKGRIKTITNTNLQYVSIYEDKINQNITYNHNAFYNDYNRLSIEYQFGMEHPNLIIQNVLTWEPIWGLDPPVKYLT